MSDVASQMLAAAGVVVLLGAGSCWIAIRQVRAGKNPTFAWFWEGDR